MKAIRIVPAIAIPVLMGVPVLVATSWLVGLGALVTGALCVVAVLRASLAWATTAGAVALLSLAIALRHPDSWGNELALMVFGLALLLLIDGVHLCHRFEGATVTRALWRRQAAWWTARSAICLGIAIVIAALAPLMALALPSSWGPFLAGIGALLAVVGAVTFAWPRSDP